METIIGWDEQIFYWINHGWSNSVLDVILPFFREKKSWIPLYLFLIIFSAFKYKKYAFGFILAALLTVGVSDLFSSRLVKPQVERLRPCRQENMDVILRARCGSGYSFTSSHATNHFAVATFFVLTFGRVWRWSRPLWWGWAATISLGQVYVGVHFPFDILTGSLFGMLIGWLGYQVYLRAGAIPEFRPSTAKLV